MSPKADRGDITQQQFCASLIDRVFAEFGTLDILVTNTAFQMAHESIEEFTAGLRADQGSHRQLHQGACADGDQAGRPRECCGARTGLDAAHPVDDAEGAGETFGGDTPLGRPAQPVELAPMFVFLASNEARYVTGEVYAATGGHVLTADESRALAPLQEPSAFEYGGHRLFDSRRSGRRLLGRGKVIQVTALSPRRQCLEGALETRLPPKPLA